MSIFSINDSNYELFPETARMQSRISQFFLAGAVTGIVGGIGWTAAKLMTEKFAQIQTQPAYIKAIFAIAAFVGIVGLTTSATTLSLAMINLILLPIVMCTEVAYEVPKTLFVELPLVATTMALGTSIIIIGSSEAGDIVDDPTTTAALLVAPLALSAYALHKVQNHTIFD